MPLRPPDADYLTLTEGERNRIERVRDLLAKAKLSQSPTQALTILHEAEDAIRSITRAAFWRPF